MPIISTYDLDPGLNGQDRLIGSSYEGSDIHGPIYVTKTYTLSQLANFFGGFISDGSGGTIDIVELANNVDSNTQAIASANQSITVIANNQLAQATFQTNLTASFGTFDENGNLTSLSQAFADQVLQTTASDRYANAQFVTNLAASTGTYDGNGNLLTIAEAFANQVLQVTTTDRFATSEFATNLAASFGTYNPDGTLATISESFANQLLQASTASDFADATFLTNLASNFGTFDENGNLVTISTSYADQLLQTANTSEFATSTFATNLASSFGTYDSNGNLLTISSSFADDVLDTANTAEFAQASKLTALGASFGTVNPDGSVSFNNTSTYSNEILNYVDNSSALATQVSNLETTITNIPVTIRQPEPPDVTAYPLGSIWVDTDDANAIYILVDGTPRTWEPTTSEALGDLILSNAQLEEQVNLLSTDLSAEASKLTTLTAQFGVYDPATDTFTINNNAAVTSALRSYADAESAAASKVDGINSVFNIVDANGNVIKNLATFNQEITTYVDQNSATASDVSDLTAIIGDENSGLVANVQQASDVVASLTEGVKASYGLTVGVGNAISSMKLLAEDPAQPGLPATSSIIFNTGSFKIQNGSGVDQFTINTTTGKAEFSGHLQAATGTFTGELQAGNVNISNNRMTIDSGGDLLFRTSDSGGSIVNVGSIVPSITEFDLYGVVNGQVVVIDTLALSTIAINGGNAMEINMRTSVNGFFTVSGQIFSTGNITAFASDDRLKTRYGNIKDPLVKIKKINGFQYKFNDLAAEVGLDYEPGFYVGVSAQEIEEVLPEVVHPAPFDTIKHEGKTYSRSGQNYKTVQYEKIVPLLIEGIKELVDEVEILKEEIKRLKG